MSSYSSVITIRPATLSDAATLVAFQMLMAQETEQMELEEAIVTLGVRAVLDDPGKGRYYIAEVDGQIAGNLLTMSEWSDWRNGTVLWIHSVYVAAPFRRRGVFRAMYDHLRGMVEADPSLRGLRLYVERDNRRAQQIYASLGMDGEHYRMFQWMKT